MRGPWPDAVSLGRACYGGSPQPTNPIFLHPLPQTILPTTTLPIRQAGADGLPIPGPEGGAFPPTLITASSTDTRVPVWGPLKWAARARAMNQGPAPILVAPDLHAGHAAHESQRLELAAPRLQAFAMCGARPGMRVARPALLQELAD